MSGVGFSDTLPAGLVFSTPNGLTGSCGSGTISAAANTNTVSLSGSTLAAGLSCIFSVNVTATTVGTKNNTTGAMTSVAGDAGSTAQATLTVNGNCTLDIDGNGHIDALTDGLLIVRAMCGLTDTSVTNGAAASVANDDRQAVGEAAGIVHTDGAGTAPLIAENQIWLTATGEIQLRATVFSLGKAHRSAACDDDVIKHSDVYLVERGFPGLGSKLVCSARIGDARGMIVREYHRSRDPLQVSLYDFPWVHRSVHELAVQHRNSPQAVCFSSVVHIP